MNTQIDTLLTVDKIRLKAHHGWYVEERKLGGWYTVSVKLSGKASDSESFDHLASTVNYERIYESVVKVMKQEHLLIEHCCKAIFDELKPLSPDREWTVELVKENPPIKHVGATKFEIKG